MRAAFLQLHTHQQEAGRQGSRIAVDSQIGELFQTPSITIIQNCPLSIVRVQLLDFPPFFHVGQMAKGNAFKLQLCGLIEMGSN